jgi:hypothetical protein
MWLSLWFSRSGRFSSLHLSFVQIDRSSDVESKKSCIQDITAIPIMNGEVLLEAIPFSNLLFLNRVIFIDCDTLTSDLAWPSVPGRLKGAANTGVWWLLVFYPSHSCGRWLLVSVLLAKVPRDHRYLPVVPVNRYIHFLPSIGHSASVHMRQ